MISPNLRRTRIGSADSQDTQGGGPRSAANNHLLPEELKRWAELVANAEVAFPDDLNASDRARLLDEVRSRRRSRLIHFIARAIAQDILRFRGQ